MRGHVYLPKLLEKTRGKKNGTLIRLGLKEDLFGMQEDRIRNMDVCIETKMSSFGL
jgi:hypothetical protein